jgi:predicted DNA-binding protein
MSDIKSQLATFRVEPELWEAFKAQARKDGRTASEVLNEFVQSYIQTRVITSTTEVAQPVLDNLESRIDEKVVEAIAPLRAELEEIKLRLGSELGELTAVLNSKKRAA